MDRDAALADFESARVEWEAAFAQVPDGALAYLKPGDDYALGGLQVHVNWVLTHYRRVLDGIIAGGFKQLGPQDSAGEGDAAGVALRRIHPVAAPRISDGIAVPAVPDVEAVQRVERDRQPDPKQFEEEHQRQIRQKTHLARVRCRAVESDGGRVRNQNVFEQKRADRNNPREGMQPPQEKRISLTSTQRSYPMRYNGSRRTG